MLVVAPWFLMGQCPWSRCSIVLFLCMCNTGGLPFVFCCSEGGIGSISYRMTCSSNWGGVLATHPGWSNMPPDWSTLRGGKWAASGFSSGVDTIGCGSGVFCCGRTVCVGGGSFGGVALLKISGRC